MGGYEEEYRKYYSDAKAKMNIKEEDEVEYLKNNEYKKIGGESIDNSIDIYPKRNYEYDSVDYVERDNKYLSENTSGLMQGQFRGTYRGIDSYNNTIGNKGSDVYSGRNYYGYNGGGDFNNGVEQKNMLGKLANKFIFQLVVTFILFAAVITMKSIPNEQSKEVYAACKEAINKNFDYKEFIEDVKTVNIMDEVNKLKVNLNLDDAIKTGTDEGKDINTEKVDDIDTTNTESGENITGENIN
ncbi:MAG: hypothetical protein ACRDA5_06970 [Clostridium sp.]